MSQPLPFSTGEAGHVDTGADPGAPVGPVDTTVAAAAARLDRLARRWQWRRAGALALVAAGAGLPLAAALLRWGPAGGQAPLAAIAVIAVVAALWAARRRPIDLAGIAGHLDRRLPALTESGGLLLAAGGLPPLQHLQRRRAAVALLTVEERDLDRLLPWRPLRRALIAALAGAALALLLLRVPLPARASATHAAAPRVVVPTRPPAPLLRRLAVTVRPPAYTGRRAHTTNGLGVTAEERSTVTWRVDAAPPVVSATLLLDERQRVAMRQLPCGGATCFSTSHVARAPRLLRLVLGAARGEIWRSAPARLELVPDAPPSIEVLAPPMLVERRLDRPGALSLAVAVADDYGVDGAELMITRAAGSGEQVTFQDRRLPLPVQPVAARQVLRRELDLAALGFAADSELYLRVEVRDGPGLHVTRSPTVVVRPAGERVASTPLGAGLPMIAGPELFRSQRQIVLDTQKLIGEAPRLAAPEVMRRSRAIAFDQRALRLRYGTLLGQETLEGRHEEDDDETPAEDSAQFGRGGVPEELTHEHDSAESATFFTEPVRRKLRGMLGAMWNAEGALATGAPRAALPHELRALGLLKEVQQADRVYVRRSAGEGAPLDPARRLTGEVDEVRDLAARQADRPEPVVGAALAALATLEPGSYESRTLGPADLGLLRLALAERARAGSGSALAALPALDALAAGDPPAAAARGELERALWSLVPPPKAPTRRTGPSLSLWESYRARLGGSPQ